MGSKSGVLKGVLISFIASFIAMPMTFAYLLDPIADLITNLGIMQIIIANPVIWDIVLFTVLFILLFGKLLEGKLGRSVGYILGLLIGLSLGVFEYRMGFSILGFIGPVAIGAAFFIIIASMFWLLKTVFHDSYGIAGCATMAFAYPFVHGAFPNLPNYMAANPLWEAVYGIMGLLWFFSIVFLFINGFKLIKGDTGGDSSMDTLKDWTKPLIGPKPAETLGDHIEKKKKKEEEAKIDPEVRTELEEQNKKESELLNELVKALRVIGRGIRDIMNKVRQAEALREDYHNDRTEDNEKKLYKKIYEIDDDINMLNQAIDRILEKIKEEEESSYTEGFKEHLEEFYSELTNYVRELNYMIKKKEIYPLPLNR